MIDYCRTKVSVASRTIHFVEQILDNTEKKIEDFKTFDSFVNFLSKEGIRNSAGFNKNKNWYLDTLKFIYSLKEEKGGVQYEKL